MFVLPLNQVSPFPRAMYTYNSITLSCMALNQVLRALILFHAMYIYALSWLYPVSRALTLLLCNVHVCHHSPFLFVHCTNLWLYWSLISGMASNNEYNMFAYGRSAVRPGISYSPCHVHV